MIHQYHPKGNVVPYIGTWIETRIEDRFGKDAVVVPYIGTWIETLLVDESTNECWVVPYIGTWIETVKSGWLREWKESRTLYRYVD